MTWWMKDEGMDAIICDGAVRSGKTTALGLSFVLWAFMRFRGSQRFGWCGKSAGAVRRNLAEPLMGTLKSLGMEVDFVQSRSQLIIRRGSVEHIIYLFGGLDARSAGLVQGVTLAGALLDEAALMPRDFVEQVCARCSVSGSKLWFSCNPEHPEHWFYKQWILRAEERRALRLHFTMEDNPSLDEGVIARYRRLYTGVFYRRFVLGEWVAAEGRVYDFFDCEKDAADVPQDLGRWVVSVDYGTSNPTSFGLWGEKEGIWYRAAEYYYDSRDEGRQKTDLEYLNDFVNFTQGRDITAIVVDPSAASFIAALRQNGFRVVKARNDVTEGIRVCAGLLKSGRIKIGRECRHLLAEMGGYVWEDGRDAPRKIADHACDEMRYFAATVAGRVKQSGEIAVAVERRSVEP